MPSTWREICAELEAAGFQLITQRGSHRKYRHPARGAMVTVPVHPGTIKPGTLSSIRRQAGLPDLGRRPLP